MPLDRLFNLFRVMSSEDAYILNKLCNYIYNQYNIDNRYYHNIMNHIIPCLNEYDIYKDFCLKNNVSIYNENEIEFSIWYHDIIKEAIHGYTPEGLSSERACLDGTLLKISPESLKIICECIEATSHNRIPIKPHEKIIIDIDLSILGKDRHIYSEYVKNIRIEYKHVSDNDFYPKRIEILEGFLNRGFIYNTDFFINKYEKLARNNMISEIESYKKSI